MTNADVSLLLFTIAADGIALGAAASTSHTDVEMIVFLAIMLHKAPAAFGLVTFLLHEGLEKSRIKKHLLAFSLSAPVGTFLTYFCLGASFQDTLSDFNATGTCMNTCVCHHIKCQLTHCYFLVPHPFLSIRSFRDCNAVLGRDISVRCDSPRPAGTDTTPGIAADRTIVTDRWIISPLRPDHQTPSLTSDKQNQQ